MKTVILAIVLVALNLASFSLKAQVYPCAGAGPGEVVVGQTPGGNGAAPSLLCQQAGASPSQPAQRQPHWEARWGAIATDEPHGVVGSSTDWLSKDTAELMAMKDCRDKSGVDCKLQLSFFNSCGALVVGKSSMIVVSDNTEAQAGKYGVDECSKTSEDCHVYFTTCSKAALVY